MSDQKTKRVAGFHLDLKYHMVEKKFLLKLAEWLPKNGINLLLLEYEDKFPFRKYPFLRDPDAFTPEELRAFLKACRSNGLTIVPLVQSLSHLEFALDHPQFAHLRELPEVPTQICPSNPEAVQFVMELIEEIMEYHTEDEWFHCGADEAWFLGACPKCRKREAEIGKIGMWIEHEKTILEWMVAHGKRPLVWDDIFWKEPGKISDSGLPKETILMGWNYGITSLDKKGGDVDIEFGGKSEALRQIDAYHKAGYETVGAPCLNYGQLFPRHSASLENTRTWAEKARRTGMLGVVNTSWACFHVPIQTQKLYIAATAEFCKDPAAETGESWVSEFFNREYGFCPEGMAAALETIGALWELPMPEYGRPFTPLPYGYMNMVLHYPGRQDERRRRGGYPGNWDEIDFDAMYKKGVAAVKSGDLDAVSKAIDQKLAEYPPQVERFRELAKNATVNRDEAEIFGIFADYKLLALRVFDFVVRERGDRSALLAELKAAKVPLERALERCFEPVGQARMLRAWHQALVTAVS